MDFLYKTHAERRRTSATGQRKTSATRPVQRRDYVNEGHPHKLGRRPGGRQARQWGLRACGQGRRGQGAEDGASRRTPQRGDDPKAVGVHSEGILRVGVHRRVSSRLDGSRVRSRRRAAHGRAIHGTYMRVQARYRRASARQAGGSKASGPGRYAERGGRLSRGERAASAVRAGCVRVRAAQLASRGPTPK